MDISLAKVNWMSMWKGCDVERVEEREVVGKEYPFVVDRRQCGKQEPA